MSNFLINEFQPSSAAAWKQKIQFELDGADYNQTLLTNTNEGIIIKPFYHSDDFEKVIVPQSKEDFKICKTIIVDSEMTANSYAITAIDKGFTAILFQVSKPINIALLFKDLLNKNIAFHFDFNFLSENFIQELATFLSSETCYLNIDPIGNLVKTGNWFSSFNNDFTLLEKLIKKNPNNFILNVNATTYQNAGSNIVQQIAYALAHSNEYLTKFGADIAKNIQFKFATGTNYFFEIAKIRAFRYLYNLILSKYNTTAIATIYSESSFRNQTQYESPLNVFREIIQTESATLAGSNTISVDSYLSEFYSCNNIKNHQQEVLNNLLKFKSEQEVAVDSYYIESLTKQLAEKALIIFKEIEKSGGFLNQLKEGTIQRKISENAKKEQDKFDLETLNKGRNIVLNKKFKTAQPIKKPRKTLIIPILPKRLSEKMEHKIRRDEA